MHLKHIVDNDLGPDFQSYLNATISKTVKKEKTFKL